ncbi:MAG: RNA-binding S4 domain-containing protein [Bacteroidota bacterium]|jgi:ribosome-associated protein
MIEFDLETHPFIELNKLLKILNFVESGGEANYVISEGLVIVNSLVETQKRKKLRVGDVVVFENQKIILV